MIDNFREQIEDALHYADYGYDAVKEGVEAGRLQFWVEGASCAVTEILDGPTLYFAVAAGNLDEIETLYTRIETWGRLRGCQRAIIGGRPGWDRTFLSRKQGFKTTHVIMQKELKLKELRS